MTATRTNFLWRLAKTSFTAGIIGLTVSDRYASVMPIRGRSMSPTFNPHQIYYSSRFSDDYVYSGLFSFDDYVLVEKFCLKQYKFSRGDIVLFNSPANFRVKDVKRIIALPGDLVRILPRNHIIRVPQGLCWVERDNTAYNTTKYGLVPLGLIRGRITHVVWPPHRIGRVDG